MRVLFIGNSHTYMNDMPQLVREMIENETREPDRDESQISESGQGARSITSTDRGSMECSNVRASRCS